MMSTPLLWSEKKRDHVKALERHLKKKRITLKNITGSRTVNHHSFYSKLPSSSSFLFYHYYCNNHCNELCHSFSFIACCANLR